MKFVAFFLLLSAVAMGQTDIEKAEQYLVEKQFTKAQHLMIAYVKNHPDDLRGNELLGDAYSYQNQWNEAVIIYKKLMDLQPKTANYHYKYGGALGMKALSISKIKAVGLIGDIKQAFLTAADLDPKHIETRWALVKLYMELPGIIGGSKSKSLQYADELQNLSKVDGYLAKGYIYEYDRTFHLAEKYYSLAVSEGGSLHCYEKLTNLFELQKQYDKAISTMEDAKNKHDSNHLNYQIGKMCAENSIQLAKGERYLRMYITNYSWKDEVPKAWANYRLAQIYRHQNNKEKALKHINLAVSELPKTEGFNKEKMAILSL